MDNPGFQKEIEPLYFGSPPKELYGCHHFPQSLNSRTCVVVLCYPIGQEYIQSHRAFYQLGVRLSQVGFHVLRFDYFGCGDSSGDFEKGTLFQWTADIHTAIEEIRKRSGVTRVCLIGLRIGATLSVSAALDCLCVDSIILWEPVVHGKTYLEELAKSQLILMRSLRPKSGWIMRNSEMPEEILGFPLTPDLKKDLDGINMGYLELRSDVKLLTLYNSEESRAVNGVRFRKDHSHAESKLVGDHKVWAHELYLRLIPAKTLNFIVDWVNTIHS